MADEVIPSLGQNVGGLGLGSRVESNSEIKMCKEQGPMELSLI